MSAVESVIVIGHIGGPGCDNPEECMVCAKSRLGKERWLVLLVCVRCGEKLDTDGALCSACEAADTAARAKGGSVGPPRPSTAGATCTGAPSSTVRHDLEKPSFRERRAPTT